MLRQFITKALEIRRAEVTGLSGREDVEQSETIPSSQQRIPQKLSFYDVVQLARQQAFAEKTRRSNEELIDLSDVAETSLLSPSPKNVQGDLALLDIVDPVTPGHDSSPLYTPELDSSQVSRSRCALPFQDFGKTRHVLSSTTLELGNADSETTIANYGWTGFNPTYFSEAISNSRGRMSRHSDTRR